MESNLDTLIVQWILYLLKRKAKEDIADARVSLRKHAASLISQLGPFFPILFTYIQIWDVYLKQIDPYDAFSSGKKCFQNKLDRTDGFRKYCNEVALQPRRRFADEAIMHYHQVLFYLLVDRSSLDVLPADIKTILGQVNDNVDLFFSFGYEAAENGL